MRNTSHSLEWLAKLISATVYGNSQQLISGIASLRTAKPGDLTFADHRLSRSDLLNTQASAVLLSAHALSDCPTNALVVEQPKWAFCMLATHFLNNTDPTPGCAPTAVVHPSAWIDPTTCIGPHVVIGRNVRIEQNVCVSAGAYIGDHVTIASDVHIGPHAVVYDRVQIGARVRIQGGAVLGGEGFGFVANTHRHWIQFPHIGCVLIGEDVEIGANTTIDRGALEDTCIDHGVKIDNHVTIGHNVRIGAHTVIAGCTGIGGSARIGRHCQIGGYCAIRDHVTIADETILTGGTQVTQSIVRSGVYSSTLGNMPHTQWMRASACFRKLHRLYKHIFSLHRTSP